MNQDKISKESSDIHKFRCLAPFKLHWQIHMIKRNNILTFLNASLLATRNSVFVRLRTEFSQKREVNKMFFNILETCSLLKRFREYKGQVALCHITVLSFQA